VFYNHYTLKQMASDMNAERQREAKNYGLWQRARKAAAKRNK
jgi:hypothetical protein